MKTILYAASAVLAAAIATPASAVVTYSTDVTDALVVAPDFSLATVGFVHTPTANASEPRVNGMFAFEDRYTLTLPFTGFASGMASNVSLQLMKLQDIDFDSISLITSTGAIFAGTVENLGSNSVAVFSDAYLAAGEQTLVITGRSTGFATYSGNLNIQNAVPEPAVWAMMVLGFGMIGASLRSRRTLMRVTA